MFSLSLLDMICISYCNLVIGGCHNMSSENENYRTNVSSLSSLASELASNLLPIHSTGCLSLA
jgi:hypothetical protein